MHQETALLIEDHADSRQLVAMMLEDLGYSVTACEDAAQGIEHLSSGGVCDVVVTDLVMPIMTGIELSTLVRRWRPKTPVVLVTGDPDAIDSAVAHGLIPLLKPFTSDQLSAVLTEALKRRQRI